MSATDTSIYDQQLDKNGANYAPLTPVSFLERSARVYPHRTALVHGDLRRSWLQTWQRCRRLASALQQLGIREGETVSIIAPNIPEHYEAHFAVPMSGAVLNCINTRLDPEAVAFILEHAETRILLVDREFSKVISRALKLMPRHPIVIDIDDPQYEGGEPIGQMTYEQLLERGDENFIYTPPDDEWRAISLNYTSGTTGNPKGVVYHHRGAYLNAFSNIVSWGMAENPVYLWTLPMFHCNGWCFPWAMAAISGTNVCLRQVRVEPIFDLIRAEKVTHFCGAPIVLNMLNGAPEEMKGGIEHKVKVMTAGAAPPAAVIEGMEALGFSVTHVYGLTETYGPSVVCAWKEEWDEKSLTERARLKARQGVKAQALEDLMVADPVTLEPVPADGETIGEIMMRGNLVMRGYLKNPSASQEAFEGGWFHSGDLAVMHPDHYIEIKDRSKDVIISGGENISSIEVEDILYRHPKVREAAVVARPDEKWGETPCAFITADGDLTEEEIIRFCRENMAHFKVPKTVVFCDLPKTSTGKIQKFVLRNRTREL